MTIRPSTALVLLALAPAALRAQKAPAPLADAPPPPEYAQPYAFGEAGGSLVLALPTGEFRHYVSVGGGGNLFAAIKLVHGGPLSLRADATFLLYGSETRQVPLGGGPLQLITVDVTTSNAIFSLNVGPQLAATRGAVRPYAFGGIGFSYFWTSSSVSGSDQSDEPFASSNNFGDGTFAVRAGGGLWIQISHKRVPVWLDLGASYVWSGRASYLRPGSIDLSFSPPVIHPITSETHLWMIHLGVAAGLVPARPKGSFDGRGG